MLHRARDVLRQTDMRGGRRGTREKGEWIYERGSGGGGVHVAQSKRRERERERETDRQTDRQTERDRQTDRQTDGQTNWQTETCAHVTGEVIHNTYIVLQTLKTMDGCTVDDCLWTRWTEVKGCEVNCCEFLLSKVHLQTDIQTDWQIDREINRSKQADKRVHTHPRARARARAREHTNTPTHTYTHARTHTHTHTHSLTHSLTYTRARANVIGGAIHSTCIDPQTLKAIDGWWVLVNWSQGFWS